MGLCCPPFPFSDADTTNAKLAEDKDRKNDPIIVLYFEPCGSPGKYASSCRVPPPLCLLFSQMFFSNCGKFAALLTSVQLL